MKVTVSELSAEIATLFSHIEEADSNAWVTKSRMEALEKEIGRQSN
jgi:hypothetical protein